MLTIFIGIGIYLLLVLGLAQVAKGATPRLSQKQMPEQVGNGTAL